MKRPSIRLTDQSILLMGAITLYGFSLLAWFLLRLFSPDVDMFELVYRGQPFVVQLLHGTIFGTAAYLVINYFIQSDFLGDMGESANSFANQMNLAQIIFISFAAGVGEELLFRVTLQYYFGIWPTAIFFVLIHGYLNINDWRVFTYGVIMTVISAGFGYLYINYGIGASMMAHFLIDLIILCVLKYQRKETIKLE